MAPLNFKLFILARTNTVPISLYDLALFRLRRIPPEEMVDAAIRLHHVGVIIDIDAMQAHILAGGKLSAVTEALISAHKANMKFSFEDLACIDLAGRDVYTAVDSYVNPQVIKCPASGYVIGVAKDGIRLSLQVRITVRVDIKSIVGGAGERTVQARVSEASIRAIGGCESHKTILENPQYISKAIQEASIAENTIYELDSVDVLEVEIVDNIGAKLATDQSMADKKAAEALAEAKKAEALATRQEMRAKKTDMKAQVVLSKSGLPNAMAAALREGNVGNKAHPVPEIEQ